MMLWTNFLYIVVYRIQIKIRDFRKETPLTKVVFSPVLSLSSITELKIDFQFKLDRIAAVKAQPGTFQIIKKTIPLSSRDPTYPMNVFHMHIRTVQEHTNSI